MAKPHLTFFCELKPEELQDLFADPVLIEDLKTLDASISLGILDLSAERAEIVHRLSQAEIPVIAWLLLPEEQGYWFNLDNVSQAQAFYKALTAWTDEQDLRWAGVGLDIEPDIRELRQVTGKWWRTLPSVLRRLFDRKRLRQAQEGYGNLVAQMHADGYDVESYQLPLIVDERMAKSSLLQRIAGLVDITVDREVLMLYSSLLRPHGASVLWSYGRHCSPTYKPFTPFTLKQRSKSSVRAAIGLGSSGGGVNIGVLDTHPLDWNELERDLRLAWHWCDEIYIFSLEGCYQQGFLPRLKSFEWASPVLFPLVPAQRVDRWRKFMRSVLWISAHPAILVAGLVGGLWLFMRLRRLKR